MPASINPKAFLILIDTSIDSMYELANPGKSPEKNGLITKQDILSLAKDLKQKAAPADPSQLLKRGKQAAKETSQENV